MSDDEIENFDLNSVPPDGDLGFILECDIHYPPSLHDCHDQYPLAPEHMVVTDDLLSPYALSFGSNRSKPSQKLILNLLDKSKYVVHYRNLQFYVAHGLIVTKIHRILSFRQRPWLKPYIEHCTEQRRAAKTKFETDLYKLLANAVFGKSMEQMRNRINVRLISDRNKALKAISKPTFLHSEIINEDLVMIRAKKMKITLNKPIYVGFTILELSKLIMYQFHYDYVLAKYGDRATLLFTDTDSLCYHVTTDDIYADMAADIDRFDTSNFDEEHPLYSTRNSKVLGKFKCETGSHVPKEFVGLKSKMYSLDVDPPKMTAKGIKKSYVRKNVRHQKFLSVLETQTQTYAKFKIFKSTNHVINTIEINKICLNAYEDKRYILEDGIHSLAYGNKNIRR